MSRRGDRASETFASIRRRADASERTGAYLPYLQAAVHGHEEGGFIGTGLPGGDVSRIVVMAIGGGIGVVLLALAALSFLSASEWSATRDGAAAGYMVIGVFLAFAGIAAIAGTWNHNYGVVNRPGAGL